MSTWMGLLRSRPKDLCRVIPNSGGDVGGPCSSNSKPFIYSSVAIYFPFQIPWWSSWSTEMRMKMATLAAAGNPLTVVQRPPLQPRPSHSGRCRLSFAGLPFAGLGLAVCRQMAADCRWRSRWTGRRWRKMAQDGLAWCGQNVGANWSGSSHFVPQGCHPLQLSSASCLLGRWLLWWLFDECLPNLHHCWWFWWVFLPYCEIKYLVKC